MNKTAMALLLASFLPTVSLAAETLCGRNELVRFSCRIKNSVKIVSVCSSKILSADSGYLQYRFGTPKKIELVFPNERKNTLGKFRWESQYPNHGFYEGLIFGNGEYLYTIYMSFGSDDEPSDGVLITKKGTDETVRDLFCAEPPTGEFSSLGDLLPHDVN